MQAYTSLSNSFFPCTMVGLVRSYVTTENRRVRLAWCLRSERMNGQAETYPISVSSPGFLSAQRVFLLVRRAHMSPCRGTWSGCLSHMSEPVPRWKCRDLIPFRNVNMLSTVVLPSDNMMTSPEQQLALAKTTLASRLDNLMLGVFFFTLLDVFSQETSVQDLAKTHGDSGIARRSTFVHEFSMQCFIASLWGNQINLQKMSMSLGEIASSPYLVNKVLCQQ